MPMMPLKIPQIVTQERIVHVPKEVVRERIVEIPVVQYRQVPVPVMMQPQMPQMPQMTMPQMTMPQMNMGSFVPSAPTMPAAMPVASTVARPYIGGSVSAVATRM